MSKLVRICAPVSSPKCLEIQSFTTFASNVTATPTPMPPATSQTNVPEASMIEKVPVIAAVTAKRMHTRPEASFSSDSPSSMCISRLGSGTRAAMADTATASVGERTAASAKATASGIAGMIQWMKNPAPTTVNTTKPRASAMIVHLSRNNPSLGMRQPSRKSKGAMNSTRKTSGSSEIRKSNAIAMRAPSAICTSGRGQYDGRRACDGAAHDDAC